MQLKIKRSQRTGGVMSNKLLFCLDARAELTAQEQADVAKYKLGKTSIYSSEETKKHAQAGMAALATGGSGLAKGLFSIAMAKLNLTITVEGLVSGAHIECKDMDELLGAEEAILQACQNFKAFLEAAATFDGREVLIDFSSGSPQLVA